MIFNFEFRFFFITGRQSDFMISQNFYNIIDVDFFLWMIDDFCGGSVCTVCLCQREYSDLNVVVMGVKLAACSLSTCISYKIYFELRLLYESI